MKYLHRLVVCAIALVTMSVIFILYEEYTRTADHDREKDVWAGKLESRRTFERIRASDDREDNTRKVSRHSTRWHGNTGTGTQMRDKTVDTFLMRALLDRSRSISLSILRKLPFRDVVQMLERKPSHEDVRLSWFRRHSVREHDPNYKKFFYGIRKYALYNPRDPAVDGLLHDMATDTFASLKMMERGTELKLLITFRNGGQAVFKPMRWGRDYETLPNHYYFNDYERHNAEIAAFHLDRLLGFYNVPPVTGRIVNMTREIYMLAEKKLWKTFYISPVGNLCFFGECTYYCDSRHSFCGNGDQLEGSLMAFLPDDTVGSRKRYRSVYRRSYSKVRKAVWEMDEGYCDRLKFEPRYNRSKEILDLIDLHIFDFITGNMDRHHIEHFAQFGNDSHILAFDNGRGFGKTLVDELSILAPLRQCCFIRESTFLKIAKLYIGPQSLGTLLDESMQRDPVHPVLADGHLTAVDRRVVTVLRTITKCVSSATKPEDVIIKDNF